MPRKRFGLPSLSYTGRGYVFFMPIRRGHGQSPGTYIGDLQEQTSAKDRARVVVDELALSCRALGRGVESPLVLAALRRVMAELPSSSVVFPFTPGPRNDPVRRWLAEFAGTDPAATGEARLAWNDDEAKAGLAEATLVVRWTDDR